MNDKEQRDVYIAVAVGGVALVLVLFYLTGGKNQGVVIQGQPSDGNGVSPVNVTTPEIPQSEYNYNITPFTSELPIIQSRLGPPVQTSSGCGGCGGSGGVNHCGPISAGNNFNTTIAQFLTLMQMGLGG